jgi:hypothetical protein
MALASNTKEQLAKRLKQDLQAAAPEMSVSALQAAADGQPLLEIRDASAVLIAIAQIKRKTYVGFNIVAELSASAAEGLPEHDLWLVIKNDQSQAVTAKLAAVAHRLGTASFKLCPSAAPAEADAVDANVALELGNDPRHGAVGQ